MYQENRFGLHRHIQCLTGQQPLQACPEGACRSFVWTKNDMGESQNAWISILLAFQYWLKRILILSNGQLCSILPEL